MKLYIEDINTPRLEDEDYRYLEMRSEGRKYYNIYRGIKNNKGVWAAVEVDGKTMKEIGEPFEITYDQGRGFEPIDPDNNKLQKTVGKALGLRRESINESPVATISTDLDTFIIPNVPEENADAIISFATKTDDVENCEWYPVDGDLGEIELTTDPVFFKLILLWAYRKKLTISDKRIGEIMRDNNIYESKRSKRTGRNIKEQDTKIEVKHEGILEVPEGKNVDELPISHFVKLAKKKGLSKITKALNNLQVWNKNDDPKLSKWAGDMIDKVSKRIEKKESIKEADFERKRYWFYSLDDPFITRISNSDSGIFTDKNVRNIKILPSPNKEGCYVGSNSPITSYEYPYKEFYGTKENAYTALKDMLNVNLAEERNDL